MARKGVEDVSAWVSQHLLALFRQWPWVLPVDQSITHWFRWSPSPRLQGQSIWPRPKAMEYSFLWLHWLVQRWACNLSWFDASKLQELFKSCWEKNLFVLPWNWEEGGLEQQQPSAIIWSLRMKSVHGGEQGWTQRPREIMFWWHQLSLDQAEPEACYYRTLHFMSHNFSSIQAHYCSLVCVCVCVF